MQYTIAFMVDSIPFDHESASMKSEVGLGGSESALIMTATALAERGHHVHIFSTNMADSFRAGGRVNGVFWADTTRLSLDYAAVGWDIFISQRQPQPFIHNSKIPAPARNSKLNILWHEDFLYNPAVVDQALSLVDSNFFVSEWQRDNFAEQIPYIRKNSFVTRNTVDLNWINQYSGNVEKDPNKLIVLSRPERHIETLVPIFTRMKEIRPELELKVCRYYSMYEPSPSMRDTLAYHDRLIQGVDGIQFLGNLSKDRLYKEIASSKLVVYPTNFEETSCIAAIEAQALGTPMVTTSKAAIKETLHDGAGVKIQGDASSEAYIDQFIQATFELLDDKNKYQDCVDIGVEHAKNYDRHLIAEEWETYFDKRFERRFSGNKQRIYDNLIWFDDVVAAEYLADNYSEEVKPIPTREKIDIAKFDENQLTLEKGKKFRDFRFTLATRVALEKVKKDSGRILDFACGSGAFLQYLCDIMPDYDITGIDLCMPLVKRTRAFFSENKNIKVLQGSLEKITGEFDFIFCGEYLEHAKNYMEVLSTFEEHLSDYGYVVISVPTGPISRRSSPDPESSEQNHVIHWTLDDLLHVFGSKPKFDVGAYHTGSDKRGDISGHFVISYQKGGEFKEIDFEKKIKTTKPMQKLSVGITCRNNQRWIRNALESIQDIADEIIVLDTGSTDKTVEIAKEYTDKVFLAPKCPYVPEDTPTPGAFDWINNQALKHATGDWYLKLDTDEEIIGADNLRKYMRAESVYDGFNIKQVHLQQDKGVQFDIPVRLFRNNHTYRYYGVLHEQPQRVDNINRSVYPQITLEDTNIAHYGYLTEDHRRVKALDRNVRMMGVDRQVYPDRELGHLLYIREAVNRAKHAVENNDPNLGVLFLKESLSEWKNCFSDPKHRLYKVGIDEVYQKLLVALNAGVEAEVKIGTAVITMRFDDKRFFLDYLDAYLNNFPTYLDAEYSDLYKKIQEETSIQV